MVIVRRQDGVAVAGSIPTAIGAGLVPDLPHAVARIDSVLTRDGVAGGNQESIVIRLPAAALAAADAAVFGAAAQVRAQGYKRREGDLKRPDNFNSTGLDHGW